MSLRIGYVNVRGLSDHSWAAACALLNTTFDVLFLAETWYVGHDIHSRDRSVVATTKRPEAYRLGRASGGLYLLATRKARAQIKEDCLVQSESCISFTVSRHRITGVYLAPSMLCNEIDDILSSLSSSTIVLGDLNTRFRNCSLQHGSPGPAERLQVFAKFTRSGMFTRLLVDPTELDFNGVALEVALTTDHCFVRDAVPDVQLRLLRASSIGMKTDHKYALHLSLGTTISCKKPPSVLRYRTRHLLVPDVASRICTRFDVLSTKLTSIQEVNRLNAELVKICQTVAADTLGMVPTMPSQSRLGPDRSTSKQDLASASVRLYKAAVQSSQENSVLLPSESAKLAGISAIDEVQHMLQTRFHDLLYSYPPELPSPLHGDYSTIEPFTTDQIAKEIALQDAQKACGSDGLHIRLLKVLANSSFLYYLHELYRRCIMTGTTPLVWNETDICMLTKDVSKARDSNNVRPITLICMFRKVFERLLLQRFSPDGWARLHPAQAGFRNHNSTCMNAVIVHHLLASRARTTAVFLDFRSAFDVVDHARLATLLDRRGCPKYIQSLISSLMFRGVRSRVLVNGEASKWFYRTCGVLQGSPLSPYLFNLFIDSLLERLNHGITGVPICLFYADDGCLITPSTVKIQPLLDQVFEWSAENRIQLNITKCGHISARFRTKSLYLGGQEIPLVQSYNYLGFPVGAHGIDFIEHVQRRVAAAVGRMKWLSRYSDSWGPAYRLCIYKQYLAPMFEYGAPLVWAWAAESTGNAAQFRQALGQYKDLVSWIANSSSNRHLVTANLCGLLSLEARFQQLRTAFQRVIQETRLDSPLRSILQRLGPRSTLTAFGYNIQQDSLWSLFKSQSNLKPTAKVTLGRFLRKWHHDILSDEARGAHLTAIIPMASRKVPGLYLADISLSAGMPGQELLFQYRRGMFMFNAKCSCHSDAVFHRGHESCSSLPHPIRLSRNERQMKITMSQALQVHDTPLTDIDFLLNTGRLNDAGLILHDVRQALRTIYSEDQKNAAAATVPEASYQHNQRAFR